MTSRPPALENGTDALPLIGRWLPDRNATVAFEPAAIAAAAANPRETIHIVRESGWGRLGIAIGGQTERDAVRDTLRKTESLPLVATLSPLYPEWLGDRSFCETHGVRFPYASGEMANGIASTRMVRAMAGADMLGFFGAAGLSYSQVAQAVGELAAIPKGRLWGVNIIHSPNDPSLEEQLADLLIRSRVPCVSASAFMKLTPAIVRCAAAGLRVDAQGDVLRARQVFAKISRAELATQFMSPPPAAMLRDLVSRGLITPLEADLAARLPVAEDITVEADSAGHTDNRPLTVILPAILELRSAIAERDPSYPRIRVGAAGGLGTPAAVAAAFALGADYVMTGSVNQAAVESGLSQEGKVLLSKADFADVAMAPSADMFELGVKVQVLKRGTMFAGRASRLYETFVRYEGLAAIPPDVRARLESEVFQKSLEQAWEETKEYWRQHGPGEVERAQR